MTDRPTKLFSIYLPANLREAAQRAADDDNRKLSNWIKSTLSTWLREHGYLPQEPR